MALAGTELRRALEDGTWKAWRDDRPVEARALKIGSNSIDLSLDRRLLITRPNRERERLLRLGCPWEPSQAPIDLHDPDSVRTMEACIPDDGFLLQPEVIYLGASRERFETNAPLCIRGEEHCYIQCIDGRSTPARVGLFTHTSAGFGDWGFCGVWVMELQVTYPTRVYAGDRLAQVYWTRLDGWPEAYSGAYQEQQSGPRAAELGKARFA